MLLVYLLHTVQLLSQLSHQLVGRLNRTKIATATIESHKDEKGGGGECKRLQGSPPSLLRLLSTLPFVALYIPSFIVIPLNVCFLLPHQATH